MTLNTSLQGRLRNTSLPKSYALFPLIEVVVNSIHSINERIKLDQEFEISKAYIKVKIIRSAQIYFYDSKSDITGFEIVDNGIGFNSKNYESFKTLDSEYKIEQGCRGVGRLLWLKAFKKISDFIAEKSSDILKPILESENEQRERNNFSRKYTG